ncbi:hypothetical protein BOW53_01905 [Solemya pervernicosa gill symbiont]|uniref:DUF3012 domain-containing protein n=2 Tax=Gammaproteobacteria incertae sedis TaxID=118884 RepID=A0A1T2LA12_9GAMM|nr:DUF3012 domain-containing protein [Candidatus Reidiella endopervernicosa]OOZ41947.1 hypothetical protein BOW53_01905 [Solemya pervernicosa gill symbiont]QKQ24912.1 DUF3012 domain-containing protein [Candidatus Reidiella endopervernicosa]
MTKIIRNISALAALLFIITACSPEVGSDAWCKQMKEKPKGEWSANEAGEYTKNCIL